MTRRKFLTDTPVSDESLARRAEALALQEKVVRQLSLSNIIRLKLALIREENHIAASLPLTKKVK
jgi:hypothetical protein